MKELGARASSLPDIARPGVLPLAPVLTPTVTVLALQVVLEASVAVPLVPVHLEVGVKLES